MERYDTPAGSGPLVTRGSLSEWEREFRARLAVIEEERELAQLRAELARPNTELIESRAEVAQLQTEIARLHGEIGRLHGEIQKLQGTLKAVEKMLQGLRSSRGYRLFRLFGRWESIERGIHRFFR
jgi:predicted  nucleic acid-binding Zn-ribbon protein